VGGQYIKKALKGRDKSLPSNPEEPATEEHGRNTERVDPRICCPQISQKEWFVCPGSSKISRCMEYSKRHINGCVYDVDMSGGKDKMRLGFHNLSAVIRVA
jgi:hypothetical protein